MLKPYRTCKPSGVEWLGDVPEHWDVLALKRLGYFRSGAGFPIGEQGQQNLELPFFKVSDMNLPRNDSVMKIWNNSVSRSTATRLGASIFPSGTIMFPKVGGALLTNKRRVVERSCCVDNNMMGCVVHRGDPGFVLLLLKHLDLATIAKPGPVPAISESEVREIRIVFPTLSEQTAIVRFLDYIDRRIRRYIRAKHKLITLLEEQKQAIIHQAVTGQVDVRTGQPYPAYKPSSVDWLGDVPEHWKILPLKRWVSTKITDGPHETPALLDDGIPFMSAESMVGGRLDFSRRRGFISCEQHEIYCRKCRPRRDDIFMCKSGATTGKVAIVETADEFSVWSPLALIRVESHKVLARLLFAVLQTRYVQRQVQDTWSYGTQPNLAMRAMERLVVVLPPIDEQQQVLAHLDRTTKKPSEAIDRAHREISLLREYRTRLIADVVTGKLDVREAAAELPEVDPLADEFDALTTQAAATGMMELEEATETLEGLAMENEATV